MLISDITTVFRQGKAVANPKLWKDRTLAANTVFTLLSAITAVAVSFGYNFNIDQNTLQALAGGIAAIVTIANSIVHVVSSDKVGLSPVSEPIPPSNFTGFGNGTA